MTGRRALAARLSRARPGRELARRSRCAAVSVLLYQAESGERALPAPLLRHYRSCLTCQAAAGRQRRTLSLLRSLREVVEPLPPGLSAFPFPSPAPAPPPAETLSRRSRAAVVSTVSMAAAAAVGVAWAGIKARAQTG